MNPELISETSSGFIFDNKYIQPSSHLLPQILYFLVEKLG
jgi:hypothetical protein